MIRRFLIVWALCIAVAACDKPAAGPQAGSCSHPGTLDTLKALVADAAGDHPLARDPESSQAIRQALSDGTVAMQFESVRTVARDEAVGRSHCAAELRLTVPAGAIDRVTGDSVLNLEVLASGWVHAADKTTSTASIAYAVQLTDDRMLAPTEN